MARGRMISKSLSTSQRFARLNVVAGRMTEFCQALYPLLNAHADDFGRLPGDPFTVKHVCHPTSRRSVNDFALALQHLDHVGLVRWYEVDGGTYVQITKFDDHQWGLKKRTTSRFPACPEGSLELPGISREIPPELKRTKGNSTQEIDQEIAPQNTAPAPTKELFALFNELHQKRFKSKAAIDGGKDGSILAKLCRERGADDVKRLIEAFFQIRDSWVEARGFSVGMFKSQLPKLLAMRPVQAEPIEFWMDECKRIHPRLCENSYQHHERKRRAAS